MVLPVSSRDLRSLRIQFQPPPPCSLNVDGVAAAIIGAPVVSCVTRESAEAGAGRLNFKGESREAFCLMLRR